MKPIRLICATKASATDFYTSTALGKSLSLYKNHSGIELILADNNRNGLPSIYNIAIRHAASSPAILAFVHDDVHLCDFYWREQIHAAMAEFDIVGVAGTTRRHPGQPAFFIKDTSMVFESPEFLSGAVGHGKGFPSHEIMVFGPPKQECKLLDGLILIANSERLIERGVQFDERFQFHFYDMDFCRQAELRGLRMGTWPISVVHESKGNYNQTWVDGYNTYIAKYGT